MATAIVLAGGDSRRVDGHDKAFATLDGKPPITHVLEGSSRPSIVGCNVPSIGKRLFDAKGRLYNVNTKADLERLKTQPLRPKRYSLRVQARRPKH